MSTARQRRREERVSQISSHQASAHRRCAEWARGGGSVKMWAEVFTPFNAEIIGSIATSIYRSCSELPDARPGRDLPLQFEILRLREISRSKVSTISSSFTVKTAWRKVAGRFLKNKTEQILGKSIFQKYASGLGLSADIAPNSEMYTSRQEPYSPHGITWRSGH